VIRVGWFVQLESIRSSGMERVRRKGSPTLTLKEKVARRR
jgi:hypothetical protein